MNSFCVKFCGSIMLSRRFDSHLVALYASAHSPETLKKVLSSGMSSNSAATAIAPCSPQSDTTVGSVHARSAQLYTIFRGSAAPIVGSACFVAFQKPPRSTALNLTLRVCST